MSILEQHFDDLISPRHPDHMVDGVDDKLIVDTKGHLPLMRKLAHGNVLEIGVDVGNSTTALLLGVIEHGDGGRLFSIDKRAECGRNKLFFDQPWSFIHGDSQADFAKILLELPEIDVLFIDGNHSPEGAAFDLHSYGHLVPEGSIILVHDILHPEFPGVSKAFYDYIQDAKPSHFHIESGSWGLGVIRV